MSALKKPGRLLNSIVNHAALSLELERAPEHLETQFLGKHLLMVSQIAGKNLRTYGSELHKVI